MVKKIEFPCPCGGKLTWKKEQVIEQGVDCGLLDIELCNKCGEKYYPDETMGIIEQKLKAKGLWGVQRKEVKFWKTGSTVTIRLPTELADKLKLQEIERGYVYQEGEHKLAIEY